MQQKVGDDFAHMTGTQMNGDVWTGDVASASGYPFVVKRSNEKNSPHISFERAFPERLPHVG